MSQRLIDWIKCVLARRPDGAYFFTEAEVIWMAPFREQYRHEGNFPRC